ncbi:unnamed protein product [Trifolium pratense]|uniref:Uncharacterized protein n=1 Tax=Trifolium pratense TaxID=57577 RepID=A0ACB0LLW6_TRIPR|nr:unnamed protein product [Trifolium pratense]
MEYPRRKRIPVSYNWEMKVTVAAAKGRNVLNFPRDYSRNCLLKSHRNIYLLDVASGKVYKSPILNSSKGSEDKFIYSGWKKFVKQASLCFKDKVIFKAPKGDNFLEVQIVRCAF